MCEKEAGQKKTSHYQLSLPALRSRYSENRKISLSALQSQYSENRKSVVSRRDHIAGVLTGSARPVATHLPTHLASHQAIHQPIHQASHLPIHQQSHLSSHLTIHLPFQVTNKAEWIRKYPETYRLSDGIRKYGLNVK